MQVKQEGDDVLCWQHTQVLQACLLYLDSIKWLQAGQQVAIIVTVLDRPGPDNATGHASLSEPRAISQNVCLRNTG